MASTFKEYLFDVNEFNRGAYMEGDLAAAKLIQNLFLMEPNTIPGFEGAGLGLTNYRMELMTPGLIAEIKKNAIQQLNDYLPDIHVDEVYIEEHDPGDGLGKALLIAVQLGTGKIIGMSVRANSKSEVKTKLVIT